MVAVTKNKKGDAIKKIFISILKGDHQRIILAKLESNRPSSLRGKQLKFHPPFLFLATVAMLVGCLKIFSSETT
jgi:hypothetical protein